jgi:peptidoglycan hydrolase CwlO-like protein
MRLQAQHKRTMEDKKVQQNNLSETQQAAESIQAELQNIQDKILPLELEVDKLSFLSQGLLEISGSV